MNVKKICKKCNSEIPEDSVFCPYCGSNDIECVEEKPEPAIVVCPKCKNEIPNDSEFCPYCGASIKDNHEIEETKPKRVINPPNTGLPIAIKFLLVFILAILITIFIAVVYTVLA